MTRTASITFGFVLVAVSCGGGLRTVPLGPHSSRATTYVVVQSEPPPAKVENIPEIFDKECLWLDGRWEWAGNTWEWRPGEWIRLAGKLEECHYAIPEALWVPASGKALLFYLPGRWYRQDGTACADPPPCEKKRGT